jgi:alpha-tubulin suppressor-like RCC1 family protein
MRRLGWLSVFLAGCGGFQPAGAFSSVKQLALGAQQSCALDERGHVSCWGHRPSGGGDESDLMAAPVPLPFTNFLALADGYDCAILDDDTTTCWGAQPSAWASLPPVKHLALGEGRACGADEGGALYCGALFDHALQMYGIAPVSSTRIGVWFSCASMQDRSVRCWGDNSVGQLGDGTRTDRDAPGVEVMLPEREQSVAVGSLHACALTDRDHVWCWGANAYGQLGDGTTTPRAIPAKVELEHVVELAAGDNSTCARTAEGDVYCWGANLAGDAPASLPTKVPNLTGATHLDVAWQGSHACAATPAGILCWGDNRDGQLGDGTRITRIAPVKVR